MLNTETEQSERVNRGQELSGSHELLFRYLGLLGWLQTVSTASIIVHWTFTVEKGLSAGRFLNNISLCLCTCWCYSNWLCLLAVNYPVCTAFGTYRGSELSLRWRQRSVDERQQVYEVCSFCFWVHCSTVCVCVCVHFVMQRALPPASLRRRATWEVTQCIQATAG